ncbi:uncharacterized protein K444DRAFT_722905 [Hyaloscypha bicolor E]|uniref:Uncharacterized protein n=1 Tax=Hyaloscypha bicolor E TaxID=1095630 RepID=A0A2J6TAG0_9HELO|nr:uncharacterized protein K444DRAFT_722905 [Hyaloscypha bicolor E]PMD59978.1 hypothetical protein K444DRAFT_722905 [Hyaloscypha bicolor E]
MDQDPRLRGTKATVQFVVLYDRLMARRRGRPASNSRSGYNKKLSVLQDKSLRDYLLILYTSGRSPNLEIIQISASRLVYYNTSNINSSIACNYEFLKQIREKPISAKRLNIYIIEDIKEYFTNFDKYRRK